jgi:hypothetical protein
VFGLFNLGSRLPEQRVHPNRRNFSGKTAHDFTFGIGLVIH